LNPFFILHSTFCLLHSPSVLPWVAIEKAMNPESGSINPPSALRALCQTSAAIAVPPLSQFQPLRCPFRLSPSFPTTWVSAPPSASRSLPNPSIFILPHIGVQNLSPTPLPPCLQWVTPFLESSLRCGSRIHGCPRPGARQIASEHVCAPSILRRQTRGDGPSAAKPQRGRKD